MPLEGHKKLYEKLGVITHKAVTGFGIFEYKGKKRQIDKPCKVGDVVLRRIQDGRIIAADSKEWKELPESKEVTLEIPQPKKPKPQPAAKSPGLDLGDTNETV
ncbi:MAG: hypothetical protein LBF71_02650 [Campylobacteraceae bacterium]|jgi:hypothetical protein|nr:hypothetical protein [Campylobacteraceae bacterium]